MGFWFVSESPEAVVGGCMGLTSVRMVGRAWCGTLMFLSCLHLSAAMGGAPRLLHVFFKRLTATQLHCKELVLTTQRITTPWGMCVMADDAIRVAIDGKEAVWNVPGGPWTIHYYPETDVLEVVPMSGAEEASASCAKVVEKRDTPPHEVDSGAPIVRVQDGSHGSCGRMQKQPESAAASSVVRAGEICEKPNESLEQCVVRLWMDDVKKNIDTVCSSDLSLSLHQMVLFAAEHHANSHEVLRLLQLELEAYMRDLATVHDPERLKIGGACCVMSAVTVLASYFVYHQYSDYFQWPWDSQQGQKGDALMAMLMSALATGLFLWEGCVGLRDYYNPHKTEHFRKVQQLHKLIAERIGG